jgi:hypothetical protein
MVEYKINGKPSQFVGQRWELVEYLQRNNLIGEDDMLMIDGNIVWHETGEPKRCALDDMSDECNGCADKGDTCTGCHSYQDPCSTCENDECIHTN